MSLGRNSILVLMVLAVSLIANAASAAILIVYDKNGNQVGATSIDVSCWNYDVSVQENGKLRIVVYPDCRFSNQFILTDVDPLADTISGVRLALNGAPQLSVAAMGTSNDVYENDPVAVDPETDLCGQAVASCETWDGNPLQAGWSLSDPQSIGTQSGGNLVLAGNGASATLTVGVPANSRQVFFHNGVVSMSATEELSMEVLCNEGTGPDFVGATLVIAQNDVPVLSRWGIIALIVGMIGAGACLLRRRDTATVYR